MWGMAGLFGAAGCARAEVVGSGPAAEVLRASGAPGLAGAVIGPDDLFRIEVAGVRRAGTADAIRPDDRWHLGSNTKAMTAALYGRLVEQGRAKWGATVPELFPDLKIDPAWRTTTIEALLSHTAGLLDDGLVGPALLLKALADTRPLAQQRTSFASDALAAPPKGAPGAFKYGNGNYMVAGAAIERIAGADWETAVRRELLAPLGMTSAGFGAPTGESPWGHSGGVFGIGGGAMDPAGGRADNPAVLGPAGTAHMTLQDYAKFLRLFLTEGGGFLTPDTVRRLTAPLGTEKTYALGWGVAPRPWSPGPVLGHAGSNTMWFLQAAVSPSRGVALVAASNDAARGQKATTDMLAKLVESLPA